MPSARERAYDALLVYATRLEREALKALKAWLTALSTAQLTRLEVLIRNGDVAGALQLIQAAALPGITDVAETFQRMVVASANVYAVGGLTSELGRLTVRFDAYDPRTVAWLRQYKLDLITNMTTDVREGIRTVLVRGLTEGRNPRAVARDVRALIGLTPQQATAVLNYRTALQDGDTANALGRQLRDRRFDGPVRRAADEPLASEQVDRYVDRYRARYLTHRAENIARTESMRALAAGRRHALAQAVDAGMLDGVETRRFWYVARDERTCPICREIPGMNPDGRRLDEPFQTPDGPYLDPPIHMRCRCTTFPEVVRVVGA